MAIKYLGKYEVIERLGRGGMAEVYKAYHASLERYVAIKLLHPFLADDPEFKERFEREARNVAKLRHPNIVQVYDFEYDEPSESYYMVMELIEGQTLKERLTEFHEHGERMPLSEVIQVTRSAAAALAYAHARSMIHRDVKPGNLMIDSDGRIVLTDFGIAKIVTGIQFTASGGMVGTPAYMAPEQGLGEQGDERSDFYSLGVILFQMIAGQLPYDAEAPLAVILKHLNDPIPSVRALAPDTPEALEALINKAMAKEPDERYQNGMEFLRALDQVEAALHLPVTQDADKRATQEIVNVPPPIPTPPSTPTVVLPPRPSALGIGAVILAGLIILAGAAFGGSKLIAAFQPTNTPTATVTPSSTPSSIPTATATLTPSLTSTFTPTYTLTPSATHTLTFTPTYTPSATPTLTPTYTWTPSLTSTFTWTPSNTPTLTPTYTLTPSYTSTFTPTYTLTPSPTFTPSLTPTPTVNLTATLQQATVAVQNMTSTSVYATINALALTQNAQVSPTPNYTATALSCQPEYRLVQPSQPPDKDPIPVNTDFQREIILQNNGDCDWLPGTYLSYNNGEQFSAPIKIIMDDQQPIPPGGSAHFTFKGHTPARGGTYSGSWEVRLADGRLIPPLLTISFFTYE